MTATEIDNVLFGVGIALICVGAFGLLGRYVAAQHIARGYASTRTPVFTAVGKFYMLGVVAGLAIAFALQNTQPNPPVDGRIVILSFPGLAAMYYEVLLRQHIRDKALRQLSSMPFPPAMFQHVTDLASSGAIDDAVAAYANATGMLPMTARRIVMNAVKAGPGAARL
jgi:hypothetical protein